MKRLLAFLIASALSMQLGASPHARLHPRMLSNYHSYHGRKPSPLARSICKLPWQLVVAGGAAVSGVVFAYKVADGIQQGTVESARSSPEAFINKGMDVMGTMKAIVLIAVVLVVVFVDWRLARNRKPPA